MQDLYRVLERYEDRATECAMFTCRKLVTDMIYESRISQNVAYKAKYGEKVKKRDVRNLRLTREQYMEVNAENYYYSFFSD
jgi:hypothetical protein